MKAIWMIMAVVALLGASPARGQEHASLHGFVHDASSGETLLLANVTLAGTQVGAATNNAGYYALADLAPGTYTVVASYLGFTSFRQEVTLRPGQNLRLDIELEPTPVEAGEVVVSAERQAEEEARNIGVTQMKTQDIKQLPTILEPDVFRSLQLLPGVKAASDYSSGLYIRGGSPDQTLILLDRNTVYNPTHFFGFFSTFNPDAIKDVRLWKGGYPAEYGGRLGSVLDIYNKDGNRRHTTGSLSVGLLASRALLEGPYKKGSWMLAVRRSTLEPLLSFMRSQDVEGIPDGFYFYDINGKVNFDATRNDRLSLAFYGGNDRLDIPFLDDAQFDISVGNRTVSGNWMHLFSEKLFSNFTLATSHYFSLPTFRISGTEFERDHTVDDASAKAEFEYLPNRLHQVKVGLWAGNFTMRFRDGWNGEESMNERVQTVYGSAYIQDTYHPASLWQIQSGVRASYFSEGNFLRLEPRISVEYRPLARVRLQAGYGRYYQFLTLITSELFSAFDVWLTTDDGVAPAHGDQFVAGVKTTLARDLNLDTEVYYRTMNSLFELDPFLSDVSGMPYEQMFRFGKGYAYGVEVMLEKTRGRVNGFLGYTFGRTRRRFPFVNDEQFYTPKYDRTHDVNLVLNYHLSRAWRFSGVFTYATGQAYTEPGGQFRLQDYPLGSAEVMGLVSRYNQARLPAYHRLDVGFSRTGRFFGFADYELQLQAINVYSRRNVWFYYFEFEPDNTVKKNEAPQIPVLIPNLAFTLTF